MTQPVQPLPGLDGLTAPGRQQLLDDTDRSFVRGTRYSRDDQALARKLCQDAGGAALALFQAALCDGDAAAGIGHVIARDPGPRRAEDSPSPDAGARKPLKLGSASVGANTSWRLDFALSASVLDVRPRARVETDSGTGLAAGAGNAAGVTTCVAGAIGTVSSLAALLAGNGRALHAPVRRIDRRHRGPQLPSESGRDGVRVLGSPAGVGTASAALLGLGVRAGQRVPGEGSSRILTLGPGLAATPPKEWPWVASWSLEPADGSFDEATSPAMTAPRPGGAGTLRRPRWRDR